MDEKAKQKMALINYISRLEFDIAAWRSKNSQSNPGAYMELRAMKRDLERAQTILKILNRDAVENRI